MIMTRGDVWLDPLRKSMFIVWPGGRQRRRYHYRFQTLASKMEHRRWEMAWARKRNRVDLA